MGACSLGVQLGRPWSSGDQEEGCGGRVSQSATVSSTRVDAWLKACWRCPNGGLIAGGVVTVGAAADFDAVAAADAAAAASKAAVAGPFGRILG